MKKRILSKILALSLLLVLIIPTVACSQQSLAQEDDRPLVYTSFYPIYDMTKIIGQDDINIKSFIRPGQDPHMWEPSPKAMKELSKADLLIINGANLEPWADQVQASLPDLKIINLSADLDLITYKGAAAKGEFQYLAKMNIESTKPYMLEFGHTHEPHMRVAFMKAGDNDQLDDLIAKGKEIMEEEGRVVAQKSLVEINTDEVYKLEMGHEYGFIDFSFPEPGEYYMVSDRISEDLLSYSWLDDEKNDYEPEAIMTSSTSELDKVSFDPHTWLSLVNAKRNLNSINVALGELVPEKARTFNRRKVEAVSQLSDLEYEYTVKFRELDNRNFVVTHYAYAYTARDFDLVQHPLQGLTSMEDPSLQKIRRAIEYCEETGVKCIFYETASQPLAAETIALEIGGYHEDLNSMEYQGIDKNTSYIEIMSENLEKLYQAMKEIEDE